MKNKKRFVVLALVALLITVIGATYAYFAAQRGTGGSANINVEAGTTDSLTFTKGNPITIDANSDNFKSGAPNQSGDTTVSAHLVANNGNYTALETYNVYLNLIDNPFVYTRENSPELILQVTDPEGNPLETLEDKSIKHVSITGVDDEEDPLVGFDITTATGLIPIKLNEPIEANPSEDDATNGKADEEWQIKIILINRDYDQQVNTGKTFSAQAVITHEALPNIKVETANITNNSMKVIATISDYEDTIDKVEFKINDEVDNGWHQADNDSENVYSYTFNNLTQDKKYEVSTKISFADSEVLKVIDESITSKKTLADACPNGGNLADCVIGLYNKNSNYEDTKLYYHDNNLVDGANDLSYRYTGGDYTLTKTATDDGYNSINDLIKLDCGETVKPNANDYCSSGAKYTLNYKKELDNLITLKQTLSQALTDGYITDNNVKNFVCFGGECNNKDNLYRIIGAFNVNGEYRVKLVKADVADKNLLGDTGNYISQGFSSSYNTYVGNHDEWSRYTWDKNGQNVWSESELNTYNLNDYYLSKIGTWTSKIADTNWQVGGMSTNVGYGQTVHDAYENELGTLNASLTYPAKIGLMYVSDYYYGATQELWSLPGYISSLVDYRKAAWDNWAWIGVDMWFITPSTNNNANAFYSPTYGYVYALSTTSAYVAVRPSFYLNSNVNYISGTGTESDPIIIN